VIGSASRALRRDRVLGDSPASQLRKAPTPAVPAKHLIARSVVLVILIATPALMVLHAGVMSDPDIWWHLRTAEWITQHHAVPRVDPFSIYGAGKPWQAYSWLFELVVYEFFQSWNLIGIVLYTSVMVAAIAAALFHLIDRFQSDFTKSALITIAGIVCLSGILTPRPWMFTILFFIIELGIVLDARKSGNWRGLLLLLPLFALWSNIHIQFIDGLVVLGLAVVEPIAERWWPWKSTRLRSGHVWPIFAGCVLAAAANPYGWRIYQVAWLLVSQSGGANIIIELHAPSFRDAADFILLLMPLLAAAALTWTRRPAFFDTFLLAAGCYLSFRSMRDKWFLAIVACAILASALPSSEKPRRPLPLYAVLPALLFSAALLFAGIPLFGMTNAGLKDALAREFPVAAVEAVRQDGWNGRLFNDFDWGGFLIWWLRQPVSIDGRTPVHGDDRVARNVDTWSGKPDWASDPDLDAASLVIAPVQLPLTAILRLDPNFALVHEDRVAVVFIRKAGGGSLGSPAGTQR
jgi:hypothetical protein